MRRGLQGRACGQTAENAVSSRSHALLSLTVKQQRRTQGRLTVSNLSLVDLAGSERGDTSAGGKRLQESQAINKSLLALGNVVNALAGGPRGPQTSPMSGGGPSGGGAGIRRRHVPYRESKLTRLLRHSLGGNAFAVLIICCSPHSRNIQETLSSLRFGDRAAKLENRPAAQDRVSVAALREQLRDTTQALRMYEACLRSLRIAVGQQQQAIGVLQQLLPAGAPMKPEDLYLLKSAKTAAKDAILADAAAHMPGGMKGQFAADQGPPKPLVGPTIRQGGPSAIPVHKQTTTAAPSNQRRSQSCPPPRGPLPQRGGLPPTQTRLKAGTPSPPGGPPGTRGGPPNKNPRVSQAAAAGARGAAAVAAAQRRREAEEQQQRNRAAARRLAAARQAALQANTAAATVATPTPPPVPAAAAATARGHQQQQKGGTNHPDGEEPSVNWLPQANEAQRGLPG